MSDFSAEDLTVMLDAYNARHAEGAAAPIQTEAENTDATAVKEQTVTEPVIQAQPEQVDKDNAAFAEMRAQNKLYGDLIKKMADANGIQYQNEADLINALNGDALNKIAERKGVPVEILQRMEQLEQNSRNWEAQQNQQRLTNGFQNLMTKYNLDQTGLTNFAGELDKAGVDINTVDIEKEYVSMHLDDIIAARTAAAVAEALKQEKELGSSGVSVMRKGSGAMTGGGSSEKIGSVADLRAFLSANGK